MAEEEDQIEELEDLDADSLNKDCILFAIDCHPSMLESKDDAPAAIVSCLQCISSVYKNKVISSPDDILGILFFHSGKHKNSTNFPHIFLFQALEQPDAPIMQTLELLIKTPEKLFEIIGPPSDVEIPMGNVFWTSSSILTQATSGKNISKRVFLFTNQDNPHPSNQSLKRAAKTRARDLGDLGIDLELLSMNPPGRRFDLFHFYRDVIAEDGDQVERFPDVSHKFSELLLRVRRKEAKRRALKKLGFSLGPDMTMGVRLYSLIQEAKKAGGQYVWMESDTNQISTPKTEWFSSETGASVQKENLKLTFNYGGRSVEFAQEEVNELKTLGETGLSLLYFAPRSKLNLISHHLNKSTFVFPDESQVKGSSALFLSLIEELETQEKVAICRYVARRGTFPRFVALVPQAERIDEAGFQVRSAGLHLVPLPFAEEIRHLEFSDQDNPASAEAIDKAKDIIGKLILGDAFNPDNYDNPAIQKFYAYLQALALNEEDVEPIVDCTLPDTEMIDRRINQMVQDVQNLLGLTNAVERPKERKRKAVFEEDAPAEKPSVEQLAKSGTLDELTVSDMKEFLTSIGERPKRLKAEVMGQIYDYFAVKIEE